MIIRDVQTFTRVVQRLVRRDRRAAACCREFVRLSIGNATFYLEQTVAAAISAHVDTTEVQFFPPHIDTRGGFAGVRTAHGHHL